MIIFLFEYVPIVRVRSCNVLSLPLHVLPVFFFQVNALESCEIKNLFRFSYC